MDVKNRDHGQTFDDAEMVWDYLFSGVRKLPTARLFTPRRSANRRRCVGRCHRRVIEPSEFKRIRETQRGRQLNELTLGILGMGRVGRRVSHIAALGFGMNVIYNDLEDVASQLDFPATAVDKPTLFRPGRCPLHPR